MTKKYNDGQEVEVLTQREPDVWQRAFIRSAACCLGYGVTLRSSGYKTHAISRNIRPVDLTLGDLAGVLEPYEAFNGLYVMHVETGETKGAGDGSETTLADLCELARTDPVSFVEAYGPESFADDCDGPPEGQKCLGFTLVKACDACGAKVDINTLTSADIGFGPPVAMLLCPVCYTGVFTVTTPGGKTATFVDDASTPWEQSAGYFYHFGDGYSGVKFMESMRGGQNGTRTTQDDS